MLGTVPAQFRELVREESRDNQHRERKRRRKNKHKRREADKHSKGGKDNEVSESDRRQTEDQEVIILDDELAQQLIDQQTGNSMIEDEEEEDIDDEEFEEVDLNFQSLDQEVDLAEEMVLTYDKEPQEAKGKNKKSRKVNMVSAEERRFRRDFHVLYLIVMASYGRLRNTWCNDTSLQRVLRVSLPQKLTDEYRKVKHFWSDPKVTVALKTRKFLDFLRHLMEYWNSSYRITNSFVFQKRNWSELDTQFPHEKVNRQKFKYLVQSRMGSSEMCLEGFVMLLRSLGLYTRLVFSLQPPDFTNVAVAEASVIEANKAPTPSVSSPRKITKDDYLSIIRSGKPRSESKSPDPIKQEPLEYPVMWAEVWDKCSQKWISIDPVVQKTIDIVGRKSKFEPPLNNKRNNCFYVVGYDQRNAVRDITRRYASNLNSKVRRKRITRDPHYALWWERVLRELNTPRTRHASRIDTLEQVEFEERDLREGMPDSFEDFRNHPVYCLESQLKQNEILHPKKSCGTVRKKNGSEATPVYKRKDVHIVRSPKAWYLKGRIIKLGERCLATKDAPKTADGDEDETRLYAEFQTELYIPPPIQDGIVPKNAYGNIDVYVESMLPKNGAHITGKHAVKAARLLGIDSAPAVVGFDFGGSNRGVANARINGIVIAKEFEEAMNLACQCLQDIHDEEEIIRKNKRLLKCWKIFLTKLRIKDRLNKTHGKLEETDENFEQGGFVPSDRVVETDGQEFRPTQEFNYSDHSSNYVPSESSESDYDEKDFTPAHEDYKLDNLDYHTVTQGGFIINNNEHDDYNDKNKNQYAQGGVTARNYGDSQVNQRDEFEGGFIVGEQSSDEGGFSLEGVESGGFLPEDAESGGFLPGDAASEPGGFLPDDSNFDGNITEESDKDKLLIDKESTQVAEESQFARQDYERNHHQRTRKAGDHHKQVPVLQTHIETFNNESTNSKKEIAERPIQVTEEVSEGQSCEDNQQTNLTEEAMVMNIAKFQQEQQKKPEQSTSPIIIDSADEPEIVAGHNPEEFDFEYSDSE